MFNSKNKYHPRWSIDEEKFLVELLKNNKSLEECSTLIKYKHKHERTISAIIYRIEYIIYKYIINENKPIEELEYLKKYTKTDIQEIKEKFKEKNIDKDEKNRNDFEKKVLNELKIIKSKQEDIYSNIAGDKNNIEDEDFKDNEIRELKKLADNLKEEIKKKDKKIAELVKLISLQ